jgi:hypothetical protein
LFYGSIWFFVTINQIFSRMKMRFVLGLFMLMGLALGSLAQQPAFPGAEGGGAIATGGRGGYVYFVTSLADTNTGNATTREGTLRWCLAQAGPRTIIFRVAGIIELTSNLSIGSNTTIAGQTAPGDGILIKDKAITVTSAALTAVTTYNCPSLTVSGTNIIIRYIRIRPGDDIDNTVGAPLANIKFETDAIFGRNGSNIIIDHCSFSWGIDEAASFYDNTNFTMQWCIAYESLRVSFHPKGVHGYGGIWGGKTASFHHNLLAHHDSRNPRMCGARYSNLPAQELVDFRNNVVYNWGSNSGYAGEGGSYNFVNNYYKYGAATSSSIRDRIFSPNADDGTNSQALGVWGTFYVNGNYTDSYTATTADNWQGIDPNTGNAALPGGTVDGIKSLTEFTVPAVTTQTAADAYASVLANVGANYKRDATDARVINEVANRLAPLRESKAVAAGVTVKGGLVDSPSDVGGYATYTFNTADVPTDTDRDGMPDAWETANGLDPNLASDGNVVAASGYTNLEEYLNGILTTPTAVKRLSNNSFALTVTPNPLSKSAAVSFVMEQPSKAVVALSDMTGNTVLVLSNGNLNQGLNELTLDASTLKAGIYILSVVDSRNNKSYQKVIVR